MKANQSARVLLLLLAVAVQTVKADSFTFTGSLNTSRENHTATLLTNGLVLVVGGDVFASIGVLSSAEIYSPGTGIWTNTRSLNTARTSHTATLLTNGQVLVAGGYDGDSVYFATAELFDPVSGTWTYTGSMNAARSLHTATLLPNGQVLVAGGFGNGELGLSSAEVYDPIKGTWTNTGSLKFAMVNPTATLLNNGQVLLAGGFYEGSYGGTITTGVQLYNPISGTWTNTGDLNTARDNYTATLLTNGEVLVAGGYGTPYLATAELFDPVSGTWTYTGSMNAARSLHTATLLPNGHVMVAGGDNNWQVYPSEALTSAEIYDPVAGTWTNTGLMNAARDNHTATLLNSGEVLLAGGVDDTDILFSAELYYSTNVLPSFTSQPQPVTVTNGFPASFAVTANAWPSLAYQWFFNGTNLPGATNALLTFNNAFPTSAGAYTVVITDSTGSVTSNPAMLTVLPLGLTAPKMLPSGQFQLSFATASGVNYTMQFSTNLVQWLPVVTVGGIGGPLTLTDPNAPGSQQRFYRVIMAPQ